MKSLILSLPLIISVSTAGSVLAVIIGGFLIKPSKDLPLMKRESGPDISEVERGFAKVFSKEEEEEQSQEHVSIGEENIDITLLGVVAGKVNMAMLKTGNRSLIIKEGESKKGITVKKVWERGAVVSYRDRDITLTLSKKSIQASGTPAQRREEIGENSQVARISRREIERLTKDPGIMFRELRLVPYVRNGRTEGFIFEWIRPGSLLYRAGLRRGDILLSINNNSIRSGEDAFRLLQILRNEPNLRIVVLRHGVRKELNVVIE